MKLKIICEQVMRILVVEDEIEIAKAIKKLLQKEKYIVDVAPSLGYAKEAIQLTRYDIVLLDRMLPDGEGTDLIKLSLSKKLNNRFLILSALGGLSERVDGLDLGADDYLVKPFEPEELLARIRAAIRRPMPEHEKIYRCANVSFVAETRAVYIGDKVLLLSSKELLIFEALIKAADRIVTHEVLEQYVYNFDDEIQSNTVASHISRMRKTFDHEQANVEFYASRGIGYMLREVNHD